MSAPEADTGRHRPFAASQPVAVRAVVTPLIAGLAVAAVFVTVFLAALHNPQPHGLPVAVTGPPQKVAGAEHALNGRLPGGFRFADERDAAAATEAVRDRDVYAALDLSGPRTARITLAGANGSAVTQTVTTAFTGVAAGLGAKATVSDVVPLPRGDSRGLAVFYYVFGLALSSFLFASFFHQSASGASLGVRIAVPLAFSVVTGVSLALIADSGFGALAGHPWQVAALSALISYAVCVGSIALTRLFHTAGLAVASALFIIVGNATGGGALNWHYLPGGWRWVSQLLPTGSGVTGLLNVQYFDSHHLGPALLTLALWIGVGLLLLIALPALRLDAVHRRHAAERRSPEGRSPAAVER
jgi:hypothetical protein